MFAPAPAKEFYSYAVEQDKPDTLILKGHTSLAAAKRAARVSYLALQDPERFALHNYGYGRIDGVDRKHGINIHIGHP